MKKIVAAVTATILGSVALAASPVLGQFKKSNGDSANAVYVRSQQASPENGCVQMTDLVDNEISRSIGNGFEVVLKAPTKAVEFVENMEFRVLNNGKQVFGGYGDVDLVAVCYNSNFVVVVLDTPEWDSYESEESDRDDDDWFLDNYFGSLTVEILDDGKKFGSDSFRSVE